VFFDNVGGIVLNEVLARLRLKAHIVLCGAISRDNDVTLAPGPGNYANLIGSRARMEGFIILDYAARFPEAVGALAGWLKEGKLKQKEKRSSRAGECAKSHCSSVHRSEFRKAVVEDRRSAS
jgi:NADPH-dependent curcumin reductase